MDTQSHNQIVSFIWSIADDCLRDVYVRGKYRDVILPMVVIRRLDAVLEDTKEQVLKMKENLDVQEILEKFKFRNQIDTMIDADILGAVIEKFVSPEINLSPNPVFNDVGEVRLPALDNHTMGTVFEELIRRFNEENNEEAGEHFTPRDVVELMADLIFKPIADKIKDTTYLVYDGASGTGGMLTVSQERLVSLAQETEGLLNLVVSG
jgi:type I restriction enzyme M protein